MRTALARALRLSCPNCGKSGQLKSWLKVKPSCESCGLKFDRIDGQWSGQENTFTVICGPNCTATESVKIRSLATGRGRFGLAFDWFMPYVTGGAAMINGLNNLTMSIGGTTASFNVPAATRRKPEHSY